MMGWREDVDALLAQEPATFDPRCPFCRTPLAAGAHVCDLCGEEVAGLIDRPTIPEIY
jgi:hypothetical protein